MKCDNDRCIFGPTDICDYASAVYSNGIEMCSKSIAGRPVKKGMKCTCTWSTGESEGESAIIKYDINCPFNNHGNYVKNFKPEIKTDDCTCEWGSIPRDEVLVKYSWDCPKHKHILKRGREKIRDM